MSPYNFTVQFPSQPVLVPVDGPARLFDMTVDLPVILNGKLHIIKAPFRTDLATEHGLQQLLIENDDPRILRPSILHDQLCDHRGDIWEDHHIVYNSLQAALILRAGMRFCGASELDADLVLGAVATFGPHWS